MTNFEKIITTLVGILIVLALVFGLVLFAQQKAIQNLEKGIATGKSAVGQVSESAKPAIKDSGLTSAINKFLGEVAAVSGNELTVKAILADFSKPKDPEKMKKAATVPTKFSAVDFETLEKNIIVKTGAVTVWENSKSVADIKVGDLIDVSSDKSPYESDAVTAERVNIVKAE